MRRTNIRCLRLVLSVSFPCSLPPLPAHTTVLVECWPCSALVGKLILSTTVSELVNSITPDLFSFLLGIGVGAEYPCGSVAASEQSEESGVSQKAQHRWFALATSEYTLHCLE